MKKSSLYMLVLGILSTIMFTIPETLANDSIVYVNPLVTTFEEIGVTFQINISISQVIDLAGWDFKLYYPSSMLNATNVIEGPFLKTAGGTFFLISDFTDSYNATHGRIWAACTLIGQEAGADGNGTLATITFKAIGGGLKSIHLSETDLIDSKMPPTHIPHTTVDGTVNIGIHDIGVTNVRTSKTIVGQGYILRINVTTRNEGNSTETFNVTAHADLNSTIVGDEITVGTQNLTLTSGNSTIVTFIWDTTGFTKGNYTISAYVWPVPGETDTADNTLTDGWIILSIAGDITGDDGWPDGKVDMMDVRAVVQQFGLQHTDPQYNPNYDIVYDLKIDMIDIRAVVKHFGETDP